MQNSEVKRFTSVTTAGPVFAYVKDGRIIRVEPMHFSDEEFDTWEVEVDGKTYSPPNKWPLLYWGHTARKWVYENRVEYPMKRVDWDPKGERNPQNRGKSDYMRISWDEAFTILADEVTRIRETYGPSALLSALSSHSEWGSLHYSFSDYARFFDLIGRTPLALTPISWEGWFSGASFMYGYMYAQGIFPALDVFQDISLESELIILWGNDPITKTIYTGQDHAQAFQFWKELGKKIIMVEPYANDTGMAYADKWIPVIPGTDAALGAAIAYLWIQEGTYDQAFLDRHCVGFDDEHLPTDAPSGSSFKSYILGEKDGCPKTPEWAGEITGVPTRVIKELAKEWAAKPTSLWAMVGGACRRDFAHEWARVMVTLQAMQGLGKPGVNLVGPAASLSAKYDYRQVGLPGYAEGGMNMVSPLENPYPIKQDITNLYFEQAIINPPQKWVGGDFCFSVEQFYAPKKYPAEGEPEIRMIWLRGSTQVCGPEHDRFIRVYQYPQIETFVAQAPWFDRDVRYADLVLPVTTGFEREDLTRPGHGGNYMPPNGISARVEVYHQKCIEPVGESKSDIDIFSGVADKLGLLDVYTNGNTEEDWLRMLYATAEIPLSFEEFKTKGYYLWPDLKDYEPDKQMKGFYEDPENNPLDTPTGKLEIFSTVIFERFGADDPEVGAAPRYIPETEGRYSKDILARYPLQLLTTHPKYRFHGKYNGVSWLKELYKVKGPDGYEYEPVYMNSGDAKARGLEDDDIVRVFNDRGQILAGVVCTQRLDAGVIKCSYGSWDDPLEPKSGALDRGGNANRLTTSRPMSKHHGGIATGSTLVEIEKVDLEKLAAKYPEGWAGKYSTWRKEEE
jgi:trimethylamine-N-oxide reductase (cytochrome c)